jgi:hypothetical protein
VLIAIGLEGSDWVDNLFPSDEEMTTKPPSDRILNEQVDETSAGQSKRHTAENRQPRIKKMKSHKNDGQNRCNKRMEEIDGI